MPIGFTTEHELALEAFSSSSFLQVNKILMKIYGIELAGFISNLVDKLKYFRSRNMLTEDGGFFLTHADQTEQIGLSDYQLRKHKQTCRKLGILSTKMVGIPPKEFYFLDLEVLVQIFKEYSLKNLGNDPQKTKGIYKETQSNETKPLKTTSCSGGEKTSSVPHKRTEPTIQYEDIKDAWNIITANTPIKPITKISDSRKKHIKSRLEDFPTITDWKRLFRKAVKTPFLCGNGPRGWVVSFDWIISNDNNPAKVMEETYINGNKPEKKPGSKPSLAFPASPENLGGYKRLSDQAREKALSGRKNNDR